MNEVLSRAIALGRHGALTRRVFGAPRGTREQAALRKDPVPGHYYPGTTAEFIVREELLDLALYLDVMRTSSDPELRIAAVHVVGEFGDASCIGPLGDLLHEPQQDARTRSCAAVALATIGGTQAETLLWQALENPAYAIDVREEALSALLDLLTPSGWDNYTFMNAERVVLPTEVRARLLALQPDITYIDEIVDTFDEAP